MKVLVVGGGGREHAIVRALSRSQKITELYCAPGNGGIARQAACVPLAATDIPGVVAFAKENRIGYVVVAPDDPLVAGMTDALAAAGIPSFGPSAAAALIEGSKSFAKNMMRDFGIPTAACRVFTDSAEAIAYVREQNAYPAVVKADGLALGKGVVIAQNEDEAVEAIRSMMERDAFGKSGHTVVIEEFLTGQEVSVLCFTDGKTLCPMVSAQDHKRAWDGDKGPNTGGMGTFSPSRVYTPEVAERCMREIFLPTMHAMNQLGRTFRGVLYFGLILTADGPKVIEYNCRFGDPETQVVLPRLKTDLLEIMLAVTEERLGELTIEWADNAAVCVVVASGGYPGSYEKGKVITGIDEAEALPDVTVFHAGTALRDGEFVTAGGRVLGVTATAPTLDEAIRRAYEATERISFEGSFFRHDIGIK